MSRRRLVALGLVPQKAPPHVHWPRKLDGKRGFVLRAFKCGISAIALARRYGVTRQAIYNVLWEESK